MVVLPWTVTNMDVSVVDVYGAGGERGVDRRQGEVQLRRAEASATERADDSWFRWATAGRVLEGGAGGRCGGGVQSAAGGDGGRGREAGGRGVDAGAEGLSEQDGVRAAVGGRGWGVRGCGPEVEVLVEHRHRGAGAGGRVPADWDSGGGKTAGFERGNVVVAKRVWCVWSWSPWRSDWMVCCKRDVRVCSDVWRVHDRSCGGRRRW